MELSVIDHFPPAYMLRLALLFVVLIVYGSLYPFTVWISPAAPLQGFLLRWPAMIDHADMVQNVLAYAPLGLFLALWRLPAGGPAAAVGQAVSLAALLSVTMESLQQFEPARVASTADIALNIGGAFCGAMLALLFSHGARAPRSGALARLQAARASWFRQGTLPNLGLAALALWTLAATSPLAPALDANLAARKLGWLLRQLAHPGVLSVGALLVSACHLTALALLARTLAPARAGAGAGAASASTSAPAACFVALLLLVFAARLVVHGRMLAGEEVIGAVVALAALRLARDARARTLAVWGAGLLLAGFALAELLPGQGRVSWRFNWIPLAGQLRSIAGLENILELFWPFFALAYFVRLAAPPARRERLCWLGALLVLALVFQLEWMQQGLPGRYGDITQVLLAVGGWLLPWSFRSADFTAPAGRTPLPERGRAAAAPAPRRPLQT